MKKPDLARHLARQTGLSKAAAADELDRVVTAILTNLKRGREVPLPGLGKLLPGPHRQIAFEPESEVRRGQR